MPEPKRVTRRDLLAAAGTAGAMVGMGLANGGRAQDAAAAVATDENTMPYGEIGGVKISRMLLGGNLIGGFMHSRDLRYVNSLFRAYATEEKILETLKIAEENGINTVFETGGPFVERYNRENNGHMQFIPHIQVSPGQTEQALKDHIQQQVDLGAAALYIWGASGDRLVKANAIGRIRQAVELGKKHDIPVGVGGHSLLVPMACEEHDVPCDFYVKTFHRDDYPSACPKEARENQMWFREVEGWYDNMWCLHPEATAEFMKSVTKPWLAFKVLAAGAILPRQGFAHAFENGADFIAVGMFDFQIKENCQLIPRLVQREQDRERPWRA